MRAGRTDNALDHLDEALAGGATEAASGRTQYAQAEITLTQLVSFRPQASIDGVQELLDLVDQVESLYLGVVQQGESIYTFAAFARVAHAYARASELLAGIRLSGLSGEDGEQIQEAINNRSQQLARQAQEALGACSERVLQLHRFDRSARACLAPAPPTEDPAFLEGLENRSAARLENAEELRAQLATNPDHLESLTELGRRYLQAGDFHAARMVLARSVEAGGGPEMLNLLGLSAAQAGDKAGALEAFSRAADGGFTAAQRNFVHVLREVGLAQRAEEAQREVTGSADSSQLLPGAR